MSGFCDFCHVWHSSSCYHPGQVQLTALRQQLEEMTYERDAQGRAAVDLFDEIQRMKTEAIPLRQRVAALEHEVEHLEYKYHEITGAAGDESDTLKASLAAVTKEREELKEFIQTKAFEPYKQLEEQLANMTKERDEAMKWKGHHDKQVEIKRKVSLLHREAHEQVASLQAQLQAVEANVSDLLNTKCDLPVEDVAKAFLDHGRLYYRTEYDQFIQARLEELLRRARLDGANSVKQAAMTLRWSRETPKEVGYYWYKRKCDSYDVIEIVEVRDRGYLYAGNHGPVMQLRGEWAGPLEAPQ